MLEVSLSHGAAKDRPIRALGDNPSVVAIV